jgi:hypothetical protein
MYLLERFTSSTWREVALLVSTKSNVFFRYCWRHAEQSVVRIVVVQLQTAAGVWWCENSTGNKRNLRMHQVIGTMAKHCFLEQGRMLP